MSNAAGFVAQFFPIFLLGALLGKVMEASGSVEAIAKYLTGRLKMRFAHMKRILRLDRFRLRGLSGVRDKVLLTATAQNLGRLVKLLCRAPPSQATICAA